MHIVESYAINCGLRIDKPWIYESYYPLGHDDYITLQPSGGADVRDYDFWDEVLYYILPELNKRGIKVVQLGNKDDRALSGCVHTQGSTSMSQLAHLIKDSKLHLGVDSIGIHIASHYEKKIVGLYCNQWTRSSGPFFSNEKDFVLHEPNRDGVKPSFLLNENPKTINEIHPEKVAQSVLDFLGIDHKIPFERIYVGPQYKDINIQNIPSSVANINDKQQVLIVRMDIEFNEEILARQLGTSLCAVATDKPINKALIQQTKNQIQNLIYIIDKDHDPDFVKFLHQNGVRYSLVTDFGDDELNKIKMDYLDYNFIFQRKKDKDAADGVRSHDISKLLYKTKKKVLKDGKCFNSVSNLKANVPMEDVNDFSFTPALDDDDFWFYLDEAYVVKRLD